jgi:hypothetical protein
LVCTVAGETLAEVASTSPQDAIFDLNVRPFLGSRGKVNKEIWDSCTGDESSRFWLMNNGINMLCDEYEFSYDRDNPFVRVRNAQVVNGCQTTVTLREAWRQGKLKQDVKVLLRIYATDNPNLAKRITYTTNSQNRITDRDLRANDVVQVNIQTMMQDSFDYFYERKNKEFRSLRGKQKRRIVQNDKAAQAYLAIVRKKPSQARGFLSRVWSDFYEEIFGNATVEDLLASYLIYRFCAEQSKQIRDDSSATALKKEVAVYGVFHLARICGFLLLKDQWGKNNRQAIIVEIIQQAEDDSGKLGRVYEEALDILLIIREKSKKDSSNPTLYFKATPVQVLIEETLKVMV